LEDRIRGNKRFSQEEVNEMYLNIFKEHTTITCLITNSRLLTTLVIQMVLVAFADKLLNIRGKCGRCSAQNCTEVFVTLHYFQRPRFLSVKLGDLCVVTPACSIADFLF
jgi:hypothetical protein